MVTVYLSVALLSEDSYPRRDVKDDGNIDFLDALLVLRAALNLIKL